MLHMLCGMYELDCLMAIAFQEIVSGSDHKGNLSHSPALYQYLVSQPLTYSDEIMIL